MAAVSMAGCGKGAERPSPSPAAVPATPSAAPDRKYLLERVDDAAVVQVYADGFEKLPLQQKLLVWHLYEAALAGRDIYYDQRYRHNLEMRGVLEGILTHAERHRPRHAGGDPALHQAVLAQHRTLQQSDGAEVRARVHRLRPSPRLPGRPC